MKRRGLLLGGGALLGGCGFHPVYGPLASGSGTVRPELASIYVAVMPERTGQLLRQALQQRMEGSGYALAKRYELTGAMVVTGEAIGVQLDSSTSRIRLDGRANWQLRRLDPKQTLVTQGQAHVLDGLNVSNQQFFAVDLETASAYARLADTLADQITLDLALYFRKQVEPT